jgi:hypothetical protein
MREKRWNQKASQRYLETTRRALQAQLIKILPLIEEEAQNEHNFITLGKILKDEQTEILQRVF